MAKRYDTPDGRVRRAEIERRYKAKKEVWRQTLAEKEFFDLAWKRRRTLRERYKLTPDQFILLATRQSFRCANVHCDVEAPNAKVQWHVDHDHRTGEVRGILCALCNWALGSAKDSPKRLDGLAKYLRDRGVSERTR